MRRKSTEFQDLVDKRQKPKLYRCVSSWSLAASVEVPVTSASEIRTSIGSSSTAEAKVLKCFGKFLRQR